MRVELLLTDASRDLCGQRHGAVNLRTRLIYARFVSCSDILTEKILAWYDIDIECRGVAKTPHSVYLVFGYGLNTPTISISCEGTVLVGSGDTAFVHNGIRPSNLGVKLNSTCLNLCINPLCGPLVMRQETRTSEIGTWGIGIRIWNVILCLSFYQVNIGSRQIQQVQFQQQ